MRYFTLQLPGQPALAALVDHLASAGIAVVADGAIFWVTDPSGIRIALVTPGHLP
jgi:hypothetical protein